MEILKCKMCRGEIKLIDSSHGECIYCGNEITFPCKQEDNYLAMYNRASHFQEIGEYDQAYRAYQHLLDEEPEDADVYWNMVLCKFGVDYVKDDRMSDESLGIMEFKPTINRMSKESLLEDIDYQAAVKYANDRSRKIYTREAIKISNIQKKYLEIIKDEPPYDVFICFKDTDESSDRENARTKASVMGEDIYDQLTAKGLKVFFSRISLKMGSEYEAYIYQALDTAKIMLLVADSKEQLKARWVKNEWSRYCAMMEKDSRKMIIPIYNSHESEMTPEDFPSRISAYQAQDMSKIGVMQDLVHSVCKLTGHVEDKQVYVVDAQQDNINSLLRRAKFDLEDRKYSSAKKLAEEILDIDPENGAAYEIQLYAAHNCVTPEDLLSRNIRWSEDKYYKRVMKYGDDETKAMYKDLIHGRIHPKEKPEEKVDTVKSSEVSAETKSKPNVYQRVPRAKLGYYEELQLVYEEKRGKDGNDDTPSSVLIKKKKTEDLNKAKEEIEMGNLRQAIVMLERLGDFMDAEECLKNCKEKYEFKSNLEEYNKLTQDSRYYVKNLLREKYPHEYITWTDLVRKKESSESAIRQLWSVAAMIAVLVCTVYVDLHYEANSKGYTLADEMLLVWSLLCGLYVWVKKGRERVFVHGILPAIGFFILSFGADTLYVEEFVDFEVVPIVVTITAAIFVFRTWKIIWKSLTYAKNKSAEKKYYQQHMIRACDDVIAQSNMEWEKKIGTKNLKSLPRI